MCVPRCRQFSRGLTIIKKTRTVAAANCKPKRQWILKTKKVLLSVMYVSSELKVNELLLKILDLMCERNGIDVDKTNHKMFASELHCVQTYLSHHGFSRGDSATLPMQETAALRRPVFNTCSVSNTMKVYHLTNNYESLT